MPYADGRRCNDADSHLMEHADWLTQFADPALRGEIPPLLPHGPGGKNALLEFIRQSRERVDDREATAQLEADVMRSAKGWGAHGAMDAAERSRTLDLLGFDAQLVFSTFAIGQVLGSRDPRILYGAAQAHNRGMAEFCAGDERLRAVGLVPLSDPERAVAALGEALAMGCAAVMVPSDAPGDFSPSHVDLEPFWATLAESGRPLMSHIGGGKLLAKRYHENGRPRPKDWLGGGENLRSKDLTAIHHSPERFLTCLTLDGVFERHPGLRCGVIEQGAMWVPALLSNLDAAARQFGRNEPELAKLRLQPSDYIRRQVKFTPFPFEDVGWLVHQAGEELFLFSSDYPHPEGGRDPLGRFEASLDAAGVGDTARDRFYSENFAEMMGPV